MAFTPQSIGYHAKFLRAEFANHTAIKYYHRFKVKTLTYQDVGEWTRRCAIYFKRMGLEKGDRLLVYAFNCPEWLITMLASALTGVILVPADRMASRDFLKQLQKETGAKALFTDDPVLLNDTSLNPTSIDDLFSLIEDIPLAEFRQIKTLIRGSDIFEIIYTSGTTSAPKGVVIRNQNLVANMNAGLQRIILEDRYRFLSILPLSHLFEQMLGAFSPLRFGASIVYHKEVRFNRMAQLIAEEGVTHLIVVPAVIKNFQTKIMEAAQAQGRGEALKTASHYLAKLPFGLRRMLAYPIRRRLGSKLDVLMSGGAALDPALEDFFESIGIKVAQGYGMTEASPMVSFNTFYHRVKGSVGAPLPQQAVRLDESGEILVGGENVISEYYHNPQATEASFKDGWYRTGDIGRFDTSGNLFILGRCKEMIVAPNGLNIFPTDIEIVLDAFDAVKESVVFEDPTEPGILLGAVILTEASADFSAIKEQTNAQLSSYQHLKDVIVWPDAGFPKTPSLKVKRKDVVKRYQEFSSGLSEEQSSPSSADPVIRILSEVTGVSESEIRPESRLKEDLGLDSLGMVELAIRLESSTRKSVEEDALAQGSTVAALQDLLANPQTCEVPGFPHWVWSQPAKLARALLSGLTNHLWFRRMFHITVTQPLDVSRVNPNRPLIIVANHSSHLDTPLILTSLPREMRKRVVVAAAADHFFGPKAGVKRWILPLFLPIFPFHRTAHFSENLARVGKFLSEGKILLVYPEGTRSRTGEMAEFTKGIGSIVKEMDADVLPIGIQGTHALWPAGKGMPRAGSLEIAFGAPRRYAPDDTEDFIAQDLQSEVAQLAGARLFGVR